MTAGKRRLLPWLLYASLLALLVATLTLTVLNDSFETFVAIAILMMLGYGTVGVLIAARREGGLLGWLMLTIAIGFVVIGFTDELLTYAYVTNPGSSIPLLGLAAWLTNWVFLLVVTPIPLVLLLFPTGAIPSRRWRFLPPVIVGLAATGVLAAIVDPGPVDTDVATIANPTGIPALGGFIPVVLPMVAVGMIAAAIASVASVIIRFRRASGDERQQLRWLAYLAVVALVLFVATILWGIAAGGEGAVADALWLGLFGCIGVAFPTAIGLAIFKYRLYDLDLVIKKTVLYGVVAILLAAVFVTVLSIVGGALIEADPATITAAIALGVASWPAVRIARRLADRVVYGRRATPYEVLTDFSNRVGGSYAAEDVLPRMARILGDAIGAAGAIVWLRVGPELRPAGRSPTAGPDPDPVSIHGDALPDLPGDVAVDVRDQGSLLGALTVWMPANDPMNPTKERLVKDLASQAGLVLRNVRLIEELRASRQRLVAAQDEERRRLERNIHDGAQQQLVALTVKLRLLEQTAPRDPQRAIEIASQLQAETTEALEDLRDLARGIYPPLLADEGLPAALEAQGRKSHLPVTVHADEVGRLEQDVEAAIYFSCLEALQNAAKYADATVVSISLSRVDGRVSFEVMDDGVGFDPASTRQGSGLQGMADRIDALGGTLEIRSSVGGGTSVQGTVPAGSGRR